MTNEKKLDRIRAAFRQLWENGSPAERRMAAHAHLNLTADEWLRLYDLIVAHPTKAEAIDSLAADLRA